MKREDIGHKNVQIKPKVKDIEIHNQWIDQHHETEGPKEEQIISDKDHDHVRNQDRDQDHDNEHQ